MTNFETIQCIVGDIIYGEKNLLELKEVESNVEHRLPVNQIYNVNLVKGQTYSFYKENNTNNRRPNISYIQPNLEIGCIKIFKVKEKFVATAGHFFLLGNDLGYNLKVRMHSYQSAVERIKCQVVGYKYGIPVLENVDYDNHPLNVNEIYSFQIISFYQQIDKKEQIFDCIVVRDNYGNEIRVRAKTWQTKELWKYKDLRCCVVGYYRGEAPKLQNMDERHPYFDVGHTYDFQITNFKERLHQLGKSLIKLIELEDSYGFKHEVFMLPNQNEKLKIGDKIKCKIERITYHLHLKQVVIDDPYYYDFHEIVEDKILEKKYFASQLGANDKDVDILQMQGQYESRSAFYILTFCNKILPKLFRHVIERRDYKSAMEINFLIISIENWILKKGIIQAFPNELTRKTTKEKVRASIERATTISQILPALSEGKVKQLIRKDNISFHEVYFTFLYCDIRLLDAVDFIKFTNSNISLAIDNGQQRYLLSKFNSVLRNRKREYLVDSDDEDFLALFSKLDTTANKNFDQFNKWTYLQILILELLDQRSEANLLKAQLVRSYASLQTDPLITQSLLFFSFKALTHVNTQDFLLPLQIKDDELQIDFDILKHFLESNDDVATNRMFKDVVNLPFIEVIIDAKGVNGYLLKYKEFTGFLASNHVTDMELQRHLSDEISWKTTVAVTNYSREFKYFVAKQLPAEDENYISENLFRGKPNLYEVVNGVVKNITEYGIFISTKYGTGLLHHTNIYEKQLKEYDLRRIFKIKSELKVQIVNTEKLNFSLSGLQGTLHKDEYLSIVERIKTYLLDIEFYDDDVIERDLQNNEFSVESEKGFVLEQYAKGLVDLSEKINYIKLAKQFYVNHKNARSYLLNIYIDYFNSLLLLEEIVNDYSFEKYETLKSNLNDIKNKIQPKTLENFSKIDRLIYFINILTLFNETTTKSFNELIEYINKYSSYEDETLLTTIAKITLSNNLMLSEILRDEKFSKNNLKRISDFIKNGIFSLNESESDRVERELASKRLYWKNRIAEDEGASLEFKSSFIKPVPDKKRKSQIAALNKSLETAIHKEGILQKIEEINGLTAQKAITHSALKTIAAFANTTGGFLLLGVSDDKKIYGLEDDYNTFSKQEEKTRDGFGKYFDAKLNEYFGDSFSSILLHKEFLKFPEGDILIIEVKPSVEEVYLLKDENGNRSEDIYIRNLSSSEKLHGKELARFIREKYRKQIYLPAEDSDA